MNNLREKFRETSWDPSTARAETPKPAGVQAWENYKAQAFQRISQPKNGADAWKAFKINSAIRAQQQWESMTDIDYFDADSVTGLGLGSIGYDRLKQLAYDGKIKITDPGDRRKLTVGWNEGWNASNYTQPSTTMGQTPSWTQNEQAAGATRGLIDAMLEQKKTGSSAVYDYLKPLTGVTVNNSDTAWYDILGGGIVQGGASVIDAFGSTLAAAENLLINKPIEWLTDVETEGLFTRLQRSSHAEIEKFNQSYQNAVDRSNKAGQIVGKYLPSVVAALPQLVLAYMTGGASAATTRTLQATSAAAQATGASALALSVANTAKSYLTNPSFQYSFLSTFGNDYEQAKADGVNDAAAYLYALLTASANAAVEVGGGIEGLPEDPGPLLLRWAKSAVEEGGEEVIQGAIGQAMQNVIYNKGNALASLTDENAVLSGKRGAEEFIGGAVVGGVLGGGNVAVEAISNRANGVPNYWLKNPSQDAHSGAVSAPVVGNVEGQARGAEAPAAAETSAAGVGVDTSDAAQTMQAARDAAQAQQDKAGYNPLELIRAALVKKNNAVSELDTAEKSQDIDSNEMRRQIEDAYASGSMTEAEYDDALDALMEQESLEGVNTLDRYNPAMMKTEVYENARGSIPDDGSQWAAGESAGEQTGELAEGTGRDQSGQVQSSRAAGRADAVLRYYESSGSQPVTARAYLGSDRAADEGQVYEVPESVIAGDQELSEIVADAQSRGLTVHLFTGEAKLANGKSAEGMIRGNEVFIRVDSPTWTATQNWEHEKFHGIIRNAPEMVAALYNDLCRKMDRRKLHRTIEIYREAYHGIYDVDENGNPVWNDVSLKRIIEEILADAYAGKDTYAQGVEEYADTARDAASQIEKGSAEVRGPPTNNTAQVDGERFALQPYSEKQKANWHLSKKIIVYENAQQLLDFVRNARSDKANVQKMYFGIVSGDLANAIRSKTGYDFEGLNVTLRADNVRKIFDDHGKEATEAPRGQRPISENDFALIPDVIGDPDDIVAAVYRGKPAAEFKKTIDGSRVTVFAVYSGSSSLDLYVQTMYAGAKKGSVANLAAANASANTPKASVGTTSNTNLPQPQQYVKERSDLAVHDSTSGSSAKGGAQRENASSPSTISQDAADVNEQFSASGGAVEAAAEAEQDPVQALPAKARRVLENKEWSLTNNLGEALRIPYKERQSKLQGIAREISAEFLQTGAVSDKTLSDIFDNAYRPNEQKLAEEFGVDVEIYRDRIEDDFRAQVNELLAQLRLATRYAEDQATEGAEQKADITLKDLPELYTGLKAARRTADKAVARNLLTDSDNMKVNSLLRGDIELDALNPLYDNVQGITEVFNAKREYEKIARRIRRWNAQRKAELYALADKLLETAGEWKDKPAGILYSRETMERNIRDIVKDTKVAQEIIDTLFKPIHDGAASANRMKNEYRDRVRALNLSRKIAVGNKISEAAAVQMLGEAEDNIRMLQQNKFMKERDGKTLEDWQGIVRDLWDSNPNLDAAKIRKGVKEFREIYDELFEQMNEVRMRNGYEPVNYRKGYFPHFQSEDGDGILGKFGHALGINTAALQLPTTINGLTHTFKPGIQWFGSAQQRQGVNTSFDAVEGFDSYIEGVADVIHQTDNIQRLRAFAAQVRYRTSDEGLRKQVDQVRSDPTITEEDKQNRIKQIYEEGRFELGNFAVELDEYTNLLAGKKSRHDRDMEQRLGRKWYAIMKAAESRVAANMVAVNPASWLTNFIPITQGAATLDSMSLLSGMWDTLRAYKQDDGMVARSSFLTNRRGSDPLVRTWAQKASATLSHPMEFIDSFTADTLVRARYNQNIKRDMSEAAAMEDADAWAASVMADRSKGATPTLFSQTNPVMKLFTQFQLEVNNQLSYVFKDIPRETKEKGAAALALALLKFMLGAYLYNEVYEFVIGRRPALDPLGIINDTVGDVFGYELSNLIELGVGAVTGDLPSFEVERKDVYETVSALGTGIAEELPFVGGLLGGGRLPISSALPDWENLGKALLSDDWSGGKKWSTIGKEMVDPLLYLLPPFGGGQVKKVIQGAQAVMEGGSYSVNSKGEKLLQYPVHNDSFGQAGRNAVSAMFFGKSSLPTAREWVESGFDSLSAKETALFDSLRENGAKSEDAYDLIRDVGELETKIEKITEIANSYFDEPLKELAMSNQMSFPQYKRYMAARAAGVSTADYAVLLKEISEEAHRQKVENQDGKPTVSQIESELWASDLTPDERRALWDSSYHLSGEYDALLEKFEAETEIGAGSTSQKVLEAVLLADSKLTDAQKRAIWESYGWDNSPW